MSKVELLKKLLPGFLPLFVFIIADEIWGTEIGLVVAIVFGVLQLVYTFIKEKRLDKFILFDTLLIVALGAVSILLDNDIFFKLKPVLINVILLVVLGLSVFSKLNIMALMTQRYMQGVELADAQLKQMNRSMKTIFWIFLMHTLLILFSAFYMLKGAWAFISGGLFYIIMGGYFAFEFIRNKIKYKKEFKQMEDEEWVPVVDDKGNVIGKAPRSKVHKGEKILHPVVHMHVINKKKMIYLQKRPMHKLVQPGKWDTAVGGHISVDEQLESALQREAREEIGLENFEARLVTKYKWETELEAELVFMFIAWHNGALSVDTDEVDEGKYWSVKQVNQQLGKDVFTPNFEHEFKLLKEKGLVS